MARPYRIQVEGGFYHINSRGDDRKDIYKSERDYEKFLEYLATAKGKYKFFVHAYCLMTNHYHLFIETTQANLSRIMQYLNTSYTVYYNHKRNRSGHLFQGRYKSILVEQDAYYSELTRYIHLNPVRAKIVKKPSDYRWSSYNAYLKAKSDGCVDIDQAKQRLTMRLSNYRSFVEGAQDCPDPFKKVYAGFMLGSVKFIKGNLNQLQTEVNSKDFAHKRAIKNAIDPETIIDAVADYYKIDVEQARYGRKRPLTAKAMAIYLLRRKTGLTNFQIGEMFGMKHSTVSMAALGFEKKIVQDKRIKAAVDQISWNFEV